MALEMRARCEGCGTPLGWGDKVFICSFECTFCTACTEAMAALCPNCGGTLVTRPTRAASD